MLSSLRPRSTSILRAPPRTSSLFPVPATIKARHFSTTPLPQNPDTKHNPTILLQDKENGFGFARSNPRPKKPRMKGVTEIRGPYYSVPFFFPLCTLSQYERMADEGDRLWESGIWLMYSRREPKPLPEGRVCMLTWI